MKAEKSKHKLTWQAYTDKAQITVISGWHARDREYSIYKGAAYMQFISKSVFGAPNSFSLRNNVMKTAWFCRNRTKANRKILVLTTLKQAVPELSRELQMWKPGSGGGRGMFLLPYLKLPKFFLAPACLSICSPTTPPSNFVSTPATVLENDFIQLSLNLSPQSSGRMEVKEDIKLMKVSSCGRGWSVFNKPVSLSPLTYRLTFPSFTCARTVHVIKFSQREHEKEWCMPLPLTNLQW